MENDAILYLKWRVYLDISPYCTLTCFMVAGFGYVA